MKTSKIICLILVITTIAIFHVWQQTQIVKLSYQRQNKLGLCRERIDQNMFLRYNLMKLVSSYNLTKSLGTFDTSYEIPHFSQIVDLRGAALSSSSNLEMSRAKGKENIFLSLFGPRLEAEAQTR